MSRPAEFVTKPSRGVGLKPSHGSAAVLLRVGAASQPQLRFQARPVSTDVKICFVAGNGLTPRVVVGSGCSLEPRGGGVIPTALGRWSRASGKTLALVAPLTFSRWRMSTELGEFDGIALTQFAGGKDKGICVQVTGSGGDFVHLTLEQARWLRNRLDVWVSTVDAQRGRA